MTDYSIDIELLRMIRKREAFDKHRYLIKDYALLTETNQLVKDMGEYFKTYPLVDEIEWPDFHVWMRLHGHPTWKRTQHDLFETITAAVGDAPCEPDTLTKFIELDYVIRIDNLCKKILTGSGSTHVIEEIEELAAEYRAASIATTVDSTMVDMELASIMDSVLLTGGVEWRLEDLNRSVGPLHEGDLVVVGKRPEVGGTTFLVSEMTHMLTQLPSGRDAIIFNNEERGDKIGARVIQAMLGETMFDIGADVGAAQARYRSSLGTKSFDVCHDTGMSTNDIERKLRAGDYGVVGINVLDKLRGFSKMEGVERLRRMAQWAREIADRHNCVVICIHQADASAEGVKWLNQSQLYGSKTGVQGEADVLIMIGATHEPGDENRRYISICKNKLPGGPRTEMALRRGKHEVMFNGDIARFTSLAY